MDCLYGIRSSKVILSAVNHDLTWLVRRDNLLFIPNQIRQTGAAKTTVDDRGFREICLYILPEPKRRAADK